MVVLRIVIVAAAVYALICLAAFLLKDRMLYHPTEEILFEPDDEGLPYEDVTFTASDGVRLHGWYIPAGEQRSRVVLFFHGNAGNISIRLETAKILHHLGLHVFLFDYRGFGKSEGKPTEKGLHRDGLAALEMLQQKGFVMSDIILFGRSLGGAVAAKVAGERTPGALVLESSFTSLSDIAGHIFPILPACLVCGKNYNTIGNLDELTCPVLVIHSSDDELIPYSHGKRLFEAASEPKRFLELSGGHDSGFLVTGEEYRKGLASFVKLLEEQG